FAEDAVMWQWTIDLQRGTVSEQQLDDRGVEFPRIDDRLAGLPARYAVTVGDARLVRYDLERGSAEEHGFGGGAPGEAVFAAAGAAGVGAGAGAGVGAGASAGVGAGAEDELAGWYMAYVYDPERDGSDLVIIDASNFDGEPVGRVKLPHRVPHGFHGNWIAE
ncbi:MAG: carotenoid oxygenase family protein, partial [Mycobacteriaceae bacterium]|nr:carotenoid oxygenase family protein [Mycobacteriaceae bacterium]